MQKAMRLIAIGLTIPVLLLACLAFPLRTHADTDIVDVAIDVDTTGNSDNALGPTEACNATPLQVGDTIDIDIVVRGVPPYETPVPGGIYGSKGIGGFGFNLLFDPAIIRVNEIKAFDGPTILKADGNLIPFVVLDSVNARVDMVDLSLNYESGDGVLVRVTLEAIGNGVTRLDLFDAILGSETPEVFAADTTQYAATSAPGGLSVGSGTCGNLTPTPTPTPTGDRTPTPSRSPSPTPSPTPTATRTSTPTIAPTATAAPTRTPAQLPDTGGVPASGGLGWPAGAALLGGVLALGAAFVIGRRGRSGLGP